MDASPTPPPEAEIGAALKSMSDGASRLMSAHLELFRTELKADAKRLGRDAAMGAAAVPFLAVAFAMLNVSLAFGLGSFIGLGWGFFVVGLVDALVGGGVGLASSRKLKADAPRFDDTAAELRRDRDWLKTMRANADTPALARVRP